MSRLWSEFGTRNSDGTVRSPARPFFRNSFEELERNAKETLKVGVDPLTLSVSPELAEVIGLQSVAVVQASIVNLRVPGNSPRTIQAKGISNPLVDSGFMKMSVTHRVNK